MPDGSAIAFDATDALGNGQSITLDAYGNTETINFCDSDEVAIANVEDSCYTNTIATIVSPKTCTHYQIVRCIVLENADLYKDYNPEGWKIGQGVKVAIHAAPAPEKLQSGIVCARDPSTNAATAWLGGDQHCGSCDNTCDAANHEHCVSGVCKCGAVGGVGGAVCGTGFACHNGECLVV